ncbi:DoxX family protein [Kineosporia sp. J2-2]|uniref:DoxX family protein n=1 Tax=Kineosporia corallincola TaxID=2835133 RepID=A0ABS5TEB4_9ACTN|nr:DoxX family protein [Kineosporia corallincola]MBT0769412.1 DoxX family protein [Kineosporia corallincola]
MNSLLLRDIAVLLARVAVGVVFIAHGWQKFSTNGMDATAKGFDAMGIPLPTVSAWFAMLVELGGGVLMIAGLAVPLVGLLQAFNMLGALYFAHLDAGLFSQDGGFEYVLILAAITLLIGAVGAGRLSIDQVISPRLARGVAAPAGAAA